LVISLKDFVVIEYLFMSISWLKIKQLGAFCQEKWQRHQHLISFLLILLPLINVCFIIHQYGVNVPYRDQIKTPGEHIANLALGKFNFWELFKQHNDSRKFFPSAIFTFMAYLNQSWDTKLEMFVSVAFAALAILFLFLTLKNYFQPKSHYPLLITIAFSWLYFAPTAYLRWLYGITLHRVIPDVCLFFICWIYTTKIPRFKKISAYILAAFIGEYSFVSGIFL
jgi:hypothetical protein